MLLSKRNVLRSITRHLVALAPLAAIAFASAAFGAEPQEIRGRVVGNDKLIPDVYAEAADARNHRWNWREASLSVDAKLRVLSANPAREICIAAMQNGASANTTPVNIRITGGRANPTTIVVGPKTKIIFKNNDPYPHLLFQVGAEWKAALKPHGAQEEQRDWVAPDVKEHKSFEIHDELFPSVRLYVVVDPNVVEYWYPSRDGTFAKKLAAGDYTIKAYFSGKQVGKDVALHVPEKGAPEPITLPVGGDAK